MKRTEKMAKFPSMLVFVLASLINITSQNYNHEALVVIENPFSSSKFALPYKAVEVQGQLVYPDIFERNRKIEYHYLCPPQSQEALEHVKDNLHDPDIMFYLEENPAIEQPSKCPTEVKPVFTQSSGEFPFAAKCGESSKDRAFYNFGFKHVNLIKLAENDNSDYVSREKTMMSLYTVCFDTNENEMLWTVHRVKTGLMLQGTELRSQRIQSPYEFNTEHFALPQNTFTKVAEMYENQKTDAPFKMIPQMLVPQEDLALKIWKKTTIHRVNTAPLWDYLVPLMNAINDGIRKVAIIVNVTTYIRNKNPADNLDIYTIAYPPEKSTDTIELLENTSFGFNIWCKFIHYARKNKGIMIYVHNLPNFVSTSNSNSEKRLENAKCEKPVRCDFRKWSDKLVELSDDILSHAYCCEVNIKKVKALFDIEFQTELELLDIDHIITEGLI